MDTSPSFIPAKRRVHRKRHAPSVPPATHVVSVVATSETTAMWTFDSDIVTEGSAGGFFIEGVTPNDKTFIGGNQVEYVYDGGVAPGNAWEMNAALCAGWGFANDLPLVDGSGSVGEP